MSGTPQGGHHSPFVQFLKRLGLGRSPADCRISRLRFAFSRLRFAWVSPGVVWGLTLEVDSTNTLRGALR